MSTPIWRSSRKSLSALGAYVAAVTVTFAPTILLAQTVALPQVTDVNASVQLAGFIGDNTWTQGGNPWAAGFAFETSFDPIPEDPSTLPDGYVKRADRHWIPELYIGFGQLFLNSSLSGSYDLRGSLRTLPSLGIYLNRNTGRFDGIYFGVGTGMVQITNGRAYSSNGTVYEVSGETFPLSGALGYNYHHVFVEVAFVMRYFPSLAYKLPTGVTALPDGLPRSASLSGITVSVGYQFAINPLVVKK